MFTGLHGYHDSLLQDVNPWCVYMFTGCLQAVYRLFRGAFTGSQLFTGCLQAVYRLFTGCLQFYTILTLLPRAIIVPVRDGKFVIRALYEIRIRNV